MSIVDKRDFNLKQLKQKYLQTSLRYDRLLYSLCLNLNLVEPVKTHALNLSAAYFKQPKSVPSFEISGIMQVLKDKKVITEAEAEKKKGKKK